MAITAECYFHYQALRLLVFLWCSISSIGSLRNDDGDVNENGKTAYRFRLVKQQLRTCITPFYTFLFCHFTTATWKCLISRTLKRTWTRTTLFFFPWTSLRSFRIQLQKKIARIWPMERDRDRVSAMKFEAARLHFISDVFVAVVDVVA